MHPFSEARNSFWGDQEIPRVFKQFLIAKIVQEKIVQSKMAATNYHEVCMKLGHTRLTVPYAMFQMFIETS